MSSSGPGILGATWLSYVFTKIVYTLNMLHAVLFTISTLYIRNYVIFYFTFLVFPVALIR
jgi:hypothetical protein